MLQPSAWHPMLAAWPAAVPLLSLMLLLILLLLLLLCCLAWTLGS